MQESIDWRCLAASNGYKSLKAAYISDVQGAVNQKHPMRNKQEFLDKFNWVINRAKHYASIQNLSMETILNGWESKRTYWWLSYYQECNQPKLNTNTKIPPGIKGVRKYYKNTHWGGSPQTRKHRICKMIQELQQKNSTKKKKRWTMDYKKSRFRQQRL